MAVTNLSMCGALLVALSGFLIVFVILAIISLLIVLISRIVGTLTHHSARKM